MRKAEITSDRDNFTDGSSISFPFFFFTLLPVVFPKIVIRVKYRKIELLSSSYYRSEK